MVETIGENTYFKNVVKDAIKDLKDNKATYVFFQEQVDAIKEIMKCDLDISYDGTLYKVSIKRGKQYEN